MNGLLLNQKVADSSAIELNMKFNINDFFIMIFVKVAESYKKLRVLLVNPIDLEKCLKTMFNFIFI